MIRLMLPDIERLNFPTESVSSLAIPNGGTRVKRMLMAILLMLNSGAVAAEGLELFERTGPREPMELGDLSPMEIARAQGVCSSYGLDRLLSVLKGDRLYVITHAMNAVQTASFESVDDQGGLMVVNCGKTYFVPGEVTPEFEPSFPHEQIPTEYIPAPPQVFFEPPMPTAPTGFPF